VGSQNSSNSNAWWKSRSAVASKPNLSIPHRTLIGLARRRAKCWFDRGASAPEVLVEQVSQRLAEHGYTDQRDLDLIREDVRFTLPPELATIAAAPRR